VTADPTGTVTGSSEGSAGVRHPPGTQHPRRRRQIDWELVTCGFRGHVIAGRVADLTAAEDPIIARGRRPLAPLFAL
jgi:hypothetical protein